MNAEHTNEAGFTLIELLVALTLLAALSIGIVTAIRYGTRTWRASESAASQNRQMLSVQAALRDRLERAYPAFTATTETDGHVEFDGRADGFSVLSPESEIPGALSRVTIAVKPDGNSLDLVSTSWLELGPDAPPLVKTQVLLRRIGVLGFSYFGKAKMNEVPDWHSTWQRRTMPPGLIRVRITFADRGARAWPEFVVAPRINADVKCTFDPLMKNCLGRQ